MACAYLATLGAQFGYKAVTAAVDYTAATSKGHLAMGILENIHDGIEQSGVDVAGPVVGKAVGSFLGHVVAGHNIENAMQMGAHASDAIELIGHQAIDVAAHCLQEANNHEHADHKVTVLPNAAAKEAVPAEVKDYDYMKLAFAIGSLGTTAAIAVGAVPAAPVGVAYAVLKAYPAIMESLTKPIDRNEKASLMDDVIIPTAIEVAIKSAGYAVQGAVQFNAIEQKYYSIPIKGEQIGKGITAWLPKSMQTVAGNIGYYIGKVDAGRQIAKQEVLDDISNKGQIAKTATEASLRLINSTVRVLSDENKEGSAWKTAKNVGIVSAGILGGGVLVALAPQVAIATGGTALLSLAPHAITWVRRQMLSEDVKTESELSSKVTIANPVQQVSTDEKLDGEIILLLTPIQVPADAVQLAAPAA